MSGPLRVLIAPDSFKGTASARVATRCLSEGWLSVRPNDDLRLVPMADAGEGTLDALSLAVPGSQLFLPDDVLLPQGASWLLLRDGTAVVELAQVCGITVVDRLDPLGASTWALGRMIGLVLEAGETTSVGPVRRLGGSRWDSRWVQCGLGFRGGFGVRVRGGGSWPGTGNRECRCDHHR